MRAAQRRAIPQITRQLQRSLGSRIVMGERSLAIRCCEVGDETEGSADIGSGSGLVAKKIEMSQSIRHELLIWRETRQSCFDIDAGPLDERIPRLIRLPGLHRNSANKARTFRPEAGIGPARQG